MKKIGILSYNMHVNFTNYGSALQTYALYNTIKKLGYNPILVNYCPKRLIGANPLNPYSRMWDKDKQSIKLCKASKKAIYDNYIKFNNFYKNNFLLTDYFDYKNFNSISKTLSNFVCGSDTIFCIDEFGFDDAFFANYPFMKKHSISYAASFGDSVFNKETIRKLEKYLQNFNAIGIREKKYLNFIKHCTKVKVQQTIDPTLLLNKKDYLKISYKKPIYKNYLLYYSRRRNIKMDNYVNKIAKIKKLKVIEISLNIDNAQKNHTMRYDAGVEEFLSLIQHSNYVVTNSYHGIIFSVLYNKNFTCFIREQTNNKIMELLKLFNLEHRLSKSDKYVKLKPINYKIINKIILNKKRDGLLYLKNAINNNL